MNHDKYIVHNCESRCQDISGKKQQIHLSRQEETIGEKLHHQSGIPFQVTCNQRGEFSVWAIALQSSKDGKNRTKNVLFIASVKNFITNVIFTRNQCESSL